MASVFGLYLQTAPAELQEAVRGRKKMAEKDCREVGLAEKSKPTAGEEVRGQKIEVCGGIYEENSCFMYCTY